MTNSTGRPRRDLVALWCASAVLIVIGAAMTVAGFSDSSTAHWIEAFATLAAFAAAIIAATYAAGAFRLETRRENRYTRAQRRAQAELVAAWYGIETMPAPASVGVRHMPGILLRNASPLPVTNVHIQASAVVTDANTGETHIHVAIEDKVGLLPPASEPIRHEARGRAELIAAKTVATDATHEVHIEVAILFTDAGGRHWHRDENGSLQRLKQPPGRTRV